MMNPVRRIPVRAARQAAIAQRHARLSRPRAQQGESGLEKVSGDRVVPHLVARSEDFIFTIGAVLALVVEIAGRAITRRLDTALNVAPLATPTTPYYPLLLAGARVLAAGVVGLAALRLIRAHAAASAAERLLGRITRRPRLRITLSLRVWAHAFIATSVWYLLQNDAVRVSSGRWPLLAPWLHSYALPVFALCSLLLALAWGVMRGWTAEVERYTASVLAQASRLLRTLLAPAPSLHPTASRPPRHLFGLAFEFADRRLVLTLVLLEATPRGLDAEVVMGKTRWEIPDLAHTYPRDENPAILDWFLG